MGRLFRKKQRILEGRRKRGLQVTSGHDTKRGFIGKDYISGNVGQKELLRKK